MSILQSVLLGIVQGLTEFLPVSSSGHLAILQNLFHVETDGGMLFDIMLHIGTLAAVFVVYHKDIGRMIAETFRMICDAGMNGYIFFLNRRHKTSIRYRRIIHNNYRKFVVLILVSTIPTGILGFLGQDLIRRASATLLIPGICLLITGVLLLMADLTPPGRKMPRQVTIRQGLLIGIVQGCATLPGISRSGSTIAAGLMCGLERRFAVKYSFILSIPAILGAALLELHEVAAEPVEPGLLGIYTAGMVCAALTGYVCIKTMLVLVRNKKFSWFSWYCFAVGAVSIACHFLL